jgi:hypothetical protein
MKKVLLVVFAFAMAIVAQAQQPIATVRGLATGATATVRGVVTATNVGGDRIGFIADATGGIGLFSDSVRTFNAGDSLTVTGTIAVFGCQVQLSGLTSIVRHGNGVMPAVRVYTRATIAQAFNINNFGYLVRIDSVDAAFLGSATAAASGNWATGNYSINASGSTNQFRINASANLAGSPIPTGPFTLAGVMARFVGGTTPDCTGPNGYQILVRNFRDINNGVITPGPGGVYPIASARLLNAGDSITVTGTVTMGSEGGSTRFIVDRTGGLGVFANAALVPPFNYAVGDSVRIRGVLGYFHCLPQVTGITSHSLIAAGRPVPTVRVNAGGVSSAFNINNLGKVVQIDNIIYFTRASSTADTFRTAFPAITGSGINLRVNGTLGAEVRLTPNSALGDVAFPTGPFSVRGVLGNFQFQTPASSTTTCDITRGWQLLPRNAADVFTTPIVPVNYITIAAAKARNLGDTVTIRGVVSMGIMGGNTRYMYDLTAGIGLFTPAAANFNYNVGDSVEVRGLVGSFECLLQIGTVLSHSLIAPNVPIRMIQYDAAGMAFAYNEANVGRIVRITGLTSVTTTQGDPITSFAVSGSGTNFRLNGTEFRDLRIISATDINGLTLPAAPFNVTGVMGRFQNVTPNNDRAGCTEGVGYQLIPRSSADITGNTAFTIAFTNPTSGQILSVDSGATINFTVAITNAPGVIDSVTYSIDGEAPVAISTAPFSLPISFGANTIAPVEATATVYSGAATATTTTTFSVVLSANARLAQELKMFPNPANNKFVVKSGSLAIESISVVSVTGKQLITIAGSDNNEVNVSAFPTGYYFVKVATNKGVATLKLVKN